jgi:PKD domain
MHLNKSIVAIVTILLMLTIIQPAFATGPTPWQLFQRLCPYVSPSSPQCQQLYQQLQQQPFIQSQPFYPQSQQQQQPFIPSQQPSTSPPIANAGPNQAVTQGSIVTLDGTASFATNAGATIVSYSWIQASGTAVSLNAANTARPTFTAPTVNGTLAFSLTVTDSTGAVSSPATVSVTVS